VHCCFFRDAGQRSINLGGSTGLAYFRPKDARFEAEKITVAGNRFVGSDVPLAFVNANNSRVHQNTIYRPGKWILRILQESQGERFPACRDGVFEANLIVFDRRVRSAVNVGPGTKPESFVLRKNAWFGLDGAPPPRLSVAEKDSVRQVDPRIEHAGTAEMRATSKDRRLAGVGARSYVRPRDAAQR